MVRVVAPLEQRAGSLLPARTALIYFAIGFVWIVLSETLLNVAVEDPQQFERILTLNRVGFVAFTCIVLFAILRVQVDRIRREERLRSEVERELDSHRSNTDALVSAIVDYALILTDPDGKILSWNPGAKQLLGWSESEALGKTYSTFFAHERVPEDRVESALLTAKQDGRFASDTWIKRRDGSQFRAHLVVTAVRDSAGQFLGFAIIVRDQTERIEAERALEESRRRLQQAIDVAHIGFWEWDVREDRVFYSPEWKRQLGYEEDELDNVIDEWISRLHPEDQERAVEAIRAHFEKPDREYEVEFRLRHKDGTYRTILSHGRLLPDADNPPGLMVGTHVDLTERKQLEEQFYQAQKMESVGRLAGGIAHDFNNLLSVINGYSQLILKSLPEGYPLRDDVEQIRAAGERAAHLTRQLLAFSRKQVLQPVVVNVDALITDLARMLDRIIGEDVDLQTELNAETRRIRIDPGQLEQVLVNLAVNGRDAMPEGGTLKITTEEVELDETYADSRRNVEPGRYIAISISDTGIGMDNATQKRIFEPFFTTKGFGRGTGLGLATVEGIVSQSGGHIFVYSEPGLGTTFRIYLPLVDAQAQPVRLIRPDTVARGNETILVVEDDDVLRGLVVRMLNGAGYATLDTAKSTDALEILGSHSGEIHLLLSDVIMPLISGPELVEQALRLRPALRILFMSGYSDESLTRRARLSQKSTLIAKPFTAAQLTNRIRNILDGSESFAK